MSARRKLLVCGSTGFIGRNIAERMAERDDFSVIGTYHRSKPFQHPKIEMVQADLTRSEDVNRVLDGVDCIIQAAATTSGAKDIVTKPYYHVTDNAVMNSLIFRSAFEKNVKQLVFFSCTVMYQSSDKPVSEKDFDANRDLVPNYFGVGWTKVYMEKMSEFYSRIGPTRYTVIRHSNIYGPHDKYDLEKSHVFGATVAKVMAANEGKVTVWGTGEEERDLLHVSDLVRLVELALDRQKDPFQLVNAGCGKSVSVRDLVKKIALNAGRKLDIQYDTSKPTIKTKLCLDIAKAREVFGWEPLISIDEGIQRTIEWYRQNYSIVEY